MSAIGCCEWELAMIDSTVSHWQNGMSQYATCQVRNSSHLTSLGSEECRKLVLTYSIRLRHCGNRRPRPRASAMPSPGHFTPPRTPARTQCGALDVYRQSADQSVSGRNVWNPWLGTYWHGGRSAGEGLWVECVVL
jgi:hypothetical protein